MIRKTLVAASAVLSFVLVSTSAFAQTVDDIIAATDRGIYIKNRGSWSIDHQRYNFQFSGQVFYEVKGGKITGLLKDVAYQANTPVFWNSMRWPAPLPPTPTAPHVRLAGVLSCAMAMPSAISEKALKRLLTSSMTRLLQQLLVLMRRINDLLIRRCLISMAPRTRAS